MQWGIYIAQRIKVAAVNGHGNYCLRVDLAEPPQTVAGQSSLKVVLRIVQPH